MRFEFFPLRFEFVARDSLFFPPAKAANTLRGALGEALDAKIFAPVADHKGPSGLSDSPRPFVFRARHLDGRTFSSGQTFHFDLHVLSPDPALCSHFIEAFAAIGQEGLGPGRGRADLQRVVQPPGPVSLSLDPLLSAPEKVRIEFLSPTELKHEEKIVSEPEFSILFSRIRDRISTLRRLYGPGSLEIDFAASTARAAEIKMIHCELHREEAKRRSSRTGQTHSIGGFIGTAVYEGNLAEFLPWLEAARWTGVGRQAVWGKGEIRVAGINRVQSAAGVPEEAFS